MDIRQVWILSRLHVRMFPVSVDMSEVVQYILLYKRITTERQKRDSGMSSWLEQNNRWLFSASSPHQWPQAAETAIAMPKLSQNFGLIDWSYLNVIALLPGLFRWSPFAFFSKKLFSKVFNIACIYSHEVLAGTGFIDLDQNQFLWKRSSNWPTQAQVSHIHASHTNAHPYNMCCHSRWGPKITLAW